MAPFRGGPARSAARLRLHSAYSLLPPEPRQVPRQPNPRYPEKFPLNGKLQKERYTPFATPRLYEFCEGEENQLQYVIGLSRNPRLQRVVEPLLDSTRLQFVELEEKQRQFDEFLYRAKSWDRSRRVIVKVEVDQRGINRRFVVTNRDDLCSQSLYDHYTNRGQTENFIKAFKNHLSMDRLSCHRFLANQFRLLLHALAYQMFVRLRDYLHGTPWHKLEIETLRRRVLKIGARIRQTTRRIWVHLSSAFPEQPLFHLVLSRLNSS